MPSQTQLRYLPAVFGRLAKSRLFHRPTESTDGKRILDELFVLVFKSGKPQVASGVWTFLAGYYLMTISGHTGFLLWGAAEAAVIGLRTMFVDLHERILPGASAERLLDIYTWITAFYGICWPVSYALVPADDPGHRVLLMLVIAHTCVIGGSTLINPPWKPSISFFILPAILIAQFLVVDWAQPITIALGIVILGMGVTGFLYGMRLNRIVITSIRDRIANETLAAELAQTNVRLVSASDDLERTSHAKSTFLASMSHKIRTRLNSIVGFSEVMTREMLGRMGNAKYREYTDDIHASGSHLLLLINDILDLSRIESGKFQLDMKAIDIVPVASTCIRLMIERAQEAGIELKLDAPATGCIVMADERRMKQVVLNLVTNAIKFTPKGGKVLVTASIANDRAELSIADTGIGMREEDIPRALVAYEQVESGLSKSRQGTGLGLPMTKSLVELHNGTLTIRSVPGHGTTVLVSLPVLK